jgi:hypothetical protein
MYYRAIDSILTTSDPFYLCHPCHPWRSLSPEPLAALPNACRKPRQLKSSVRGETGRTGHCQSSAVECAKAPDQDGLSWNITRPPARHIVVPPPVGFAPDPLIPDDHEWGLTRLTQLVKQSGAAASAADENLLMDLRGSRGARHWQLARPTWTKRALGYFELDTPYGTLVVRRLIGWTIERDGAPLVWFHGNGGRVIFDKLEDAQTGALLHAADFGDHRFIDGTRWDKRPDNQVGTLAQAISDEEGGHVLVG